MGLLETGGMQVRWGDKCGFAECVWPHRDERGARNCPRRWAKTQEVGWVEEAGAKRVPWVHEHLWIGFQKPQEVEWKQKVSKFAGGGGGRKKV